MRIIETWPKPFEEETKERKRLAVATTAENC